MTLFRKRFFLCVLAWIFAVVSGCAHQHLAPKALKAMDTQAIVARMRLAKSSATEMAADAQVTYFGSKGRLRLSASLLLARPDNLRANLVGPQGGALYALGCDGSEVTVLDFMSNQGTRMPAQAASLGMLIGQPALGMTPEGLVSLIFGEAPLLPEAICEHRWDSVRGQILLTCHDRVAGTGSPVSDASSTQIFIDPETWQMTDAAFFHEAHGSLSCHIRERGVARVATRSELVWEPRVGPTERVALELSDVDVTPKVNRGNFSLEIPEAIHLTEPSASP